MYLRKITFSLLSKYNGKELIRSPFNQQHACLFAQLPFWNGCDEDDRCMPDLALQSMTDLITQKWVHAFVATNSIAVNMKPSLLQSDSPVSTCLSLPHRQFCAQPVQSRGAFCQQLSEGGGEGSLRVIEGNRRRMVMDVRLENKGENAYNARLNITYTPNLRFSSLIVKVI